MRTADMPIFKLVNVADLIGFETDETGEIFFELSDEEEREGLKTLELFKDYSVHKDYVDRFQDCVITFSLIQQYDKLIYESQVLYKNIDDNLIITTMVKAYCYSESPLVLYDLAYFYSKMEQSELSMKAYRYFLGRVTSFMPDQLDNIILQDRDLMEMINHAKDVLRDGKGSY